MQPEQVAQYLKQYKTALNALSHLKVSITSLGKGLGIQQVPAGTPVVSTTVAAPTISSGAGSGMMNGAAHSTVSAGTTPRVEDATVAATTAATPADKLLSSELESAHATIAALQAKLRERDEQIKELVQSTGSNLLLMSGAPAGSPTSPTA